VNVTLEVVNADVNPTNPDLKLHIRLNGQNGIAYIDWETFINGGEATGIIHEPSGKGRRVSPKRLKQASMKQEHESAVALGGRRQSGSGARPGNKGDAQVLDQGAIDALQGGVGRFRIENKFATGMQTILKLSDLRKIRSECTGREVPLFDVQFKEKITLRTLDNWVLMPRGAFEDLVRKAHDNS
jgi:hypothetical protein